MTPAQFEQDLRNSLVAEKLQAAVTGWIRVSDADVEREYRRQNEKVKASLAIFNAADFRKGIEPTDAELTAEFSAHKENYRVPEKRRVHYLSIDTSALESKVTVTPAEVEARYKENIAQFTTPEQVRASHILFSTQGKDDATVHKAAEQVLAKARSGADFAALARQYSDDPSKANGGDLDYFSKGSMVPEFEQAAFALEVGQISDLVKTQFGYHIIKVTGRRPASTRTLDEVRPQLEAQIKNEKAQAEATRLAGEIAPDIKTPADIDTVAAAHGLATGDSGLFARDEPLAGLGFAPAVSSEAFSLDQGKVSGSIRTSQGYAFIAVTEVKPSYLPTLDEAKDKVRDAVIGAKALALAESKAAAMAKQAGSSFATAARRAGATVKTTDLVTRGTAYPDVGVSEAIDQVAFSLKAGATSQPIDTATAAVVVHVDQHQDIDPQALAAQRETLRAQLLQQRQSDFFAAYMSKAMKNMQVNYDESVVTTLIGSTTAN